MESRNDPLHIEKRAPYNLRVRVNVVAQGEAAAGLRKRVVDTFLTTDAISLKRMKMDAAKVCLSNSNSHQIDSPGKGAEQTGANSGADSKLHDNSGHEEEKNAEDLGGHNVDNLRLFSIAVNNGKAPERQKKLAVSVNPLVGNYLNKSCRELLASYNRNMNLIKVSGFQPLLIEPKRGDNVNSTIVITTHSYKITSTRPPCPNCLGALQSGNLCSKPANLPETRIINIKLPIKSLEKNNLEKLLGGDQAVPKPSETNSMVNINRIFELSEFSNSSEEQPYLGPCMNLKTNEAKRDHELGAEGEVNKGNEVAEDYGEATKGYTEVRLDDEPYLKYCFNNLIQFLEKVFVNNAYMAEDIGHLTNLNRIVLAKLLSQRLNEQYSDITDKELVDKWNLFYDYKPIDLINFLGRGDRIAIFHIAKGYMIGDFICRFQVTELSTKNSLKLFFKYYFSYREEFEVLSEPDKQAITSLIFYYGTEKPGGLWNCKAFAADFAICLEKFKYSIIGDFYKTKIEKLYRSWDVYRRIVNNCNVKDSETDFALPVGRESLSTWLETYKRMILTRVVGRCNDKGNQNVCNVVCNKLN